MEKWHIMTIEERVAHLLMIRAISYNQYEQTIEQYRRIIRGEDTEEIWSTYYPDKDLQFFIDLLTLLGEEL